MRDILFHGKRKDNGEWVEGYLIVCNGTVNHGRAYISESVNSIYFNLKGFDIGNFYEVDPDTVGQYIELTDKNGKKIFEGDICICREYECIGYIAWTDNDASFDYCMLCEDGTYDVEYLYDYIEELKVVGNIHDNPELLEVKK